MGWLPNQSVDEGKLFAGDDEWDVEKPLANGDYVYQLTGLDGLQGSELVLVMLSRAAYDAGFATADELRAQSRVAAVRSTVNQDGTVEFAFPFARPDGQAPETVRIGAAVPADATTAAGSPLGYGGLAALA